MVTYSSSLENVYKLTTYKEDKWLEFIASRKWEELDRIENSGDIAGYDNTELL